MHAFCLCCIELEIDLAESEQDELADQSMNHYYGEGDDPEYVDD